MSSINLIKQTDDTGCGIACVAMVSSNEYEIVKSKLFSIMKWKETKKKYYTRAKQLIPLLSSLNLKSILKKSKSWQDINGVALVGVNRMPNGYFHWVLVIKDKDRFLILDPEEGEVFQGSVWANDTEGYIHSKRASDYIIIDKKVTSIKI